MKISLVVATINRTVEIEKLLTSFHHQSFKDFEVIIVDQNDDDRLRSILSKHAGIKINHIIIKSNGVSNARNLGVKVASGEIIAFPDDDCSYFPDTLTQAISIMDSGMDLITGRCIDDQGDSTVANYEKNRTAITVRNVWNAGVESTLFIRKSFFLALNGFNESLGVGTKPFGAGEGTDLILRALKMSSKIYFYPDLLIQHPQIIMDSHSAIQRAYSYGMGIGRVHKINHTPLDSKIKMIVRPLIAAVLFFILGRLNKSKFHFMSFKGRILGLFS